MSQQGEKWVPRCKMCLHKAVDKEYSLCGGGKRFSPAKIDQFVKVLGARAHSRAGGTRPCWSWM